MESMEDVFLGMRLLKLNLTTLSWKSSSGKIVRHLEDISSLFPDNNFPQLYLRANIF